MTLRDESRIARDPRVVLLERSRQCLTWRSMSAVTEQRGQALAKQSCRARDVHVHGPRRDAEPRRDLRRRELVPQAEARDFALSRWHEAQHALDRARDIVGADARFALGRKDRADVGRDRADVAEGSAQLDASAFEMIERVCARRLIQAGAHAGSDTNVSPAHPHA